MAPERSRKQTGFRCDAAVLRDFQVELKRRGLDMSPVIEGWIAEFLAGDRAAVAPQRDAGDVIRQVQRELSRLQERLRRMEREL